MRGHSFKWSGCINWTFVELSQFISFDYHTSFTSNERLTICFVDSRWRFSINQLPLSNPSLCWLSTGSRSVDFHLNPSFILIGSSIFVRMSNRQFGSHCREKATNENHSEWNDISHKTANQNNRIQIAREWERQRADERKKTTSKCTAAQSHQYLGWHRHITGATFIVFIPKLFRLCFVLEFILSHSMGAFRNENRMENFKWQRTKNKHGKNNRKRPPKPKKK